ncbi:MAG TPA: 4-dihydromethyl-trisporate dehydrogenase [Gammaproteobacteria bacterium]|uniref:Aldo/keto reductase n=1 Tax=OM182 bacterium TaxID=2510334 RepID=A0A520S6G3_9GAMM|nr:MAG: aldo/keto reductase [Gammaproteobacteria bacterium TMED163]RZO78073.1 MAG: aldo/keto reductase [OM182 bacterium]HAR90952.1 4-dihydromethyl-trisporate dehydrogenase [Gammaproteobacteria bacterium]HAU25473.1 4-dihydromethyl-trisporate dehydrogenase [Gammaproteobacteria bacterium]|tara:strand:+ start:2972 stop:3949 length:978 start_codon:yes stop_codon:yes gene_type:complete
MPSSFALGGDNLPAVGFGLWKIDKPDTANLVHAAVEAGYRHLDSAADYGNEKEAGEGIKSALAAGLCQREELWVTSKLWNTYHRPEHVRAACEKTLSDLGLDYLDLYLIHFPIALKFVDFDERYPPEWFFDPDAEAPRMEIDPVPLHQTWAAMEDLKESGLVKHIGVCNYNSALLHDLMAYAKQKPEVLQVEAHPYLSQERLIKLAQDYGITVTAFSPLGALSYVSLDMAAENESVLETDAVKIAAARLGKTPAQVVLRWGVQRGTAIIPKTARKERLKENLALFDFELSAEEMQAISALNSNRRFNDPAVFCEAAFNTFYPIYD